MPGLAERHNVQIRGEGPETVVFLHGFGCDQTVWKYVAPDFETGWRTMVFDLAGSGMADPSLYDSRRHSRLDGYAEDLIALLDELGLRSVHLVAHSVGTMIGALAAIRREDLFASVAMICPSACYLNLPGYRGGFEREMLDELIELLDSNFMAWTRVFAPIVIGNPDRPEHTEAFVETLCRTEPEFASAFARVTFFSDCRGVIGHLGKPTTILQCRQDPVAPEPAIRFVHEAVAGSELIPLDATGHCPHITDPAETSAALTSHLCTMPAKGR